MLYTLNIINKNRFWQSAFTNATGHIDIIMIIMR